MTLTADRLLQFDLFSFKTDGLLEMFQLSNRIAALHSIITEMPAFPKVPDIILRDELMRAVGSTTAIEGNTLTEDEIRAAFAKADKKFVLQKLEQEVQNSREAYEFIKKCVFENNIAELSVPIIRQIHNITTKNLPYISNKPGQLRNDQVKFGVPILPSLFPDQLSVEKALNSFIKWYNGKSNNVDDDPVIKALLSHYYLTEIHPFFDGNGRTARAIEAFCLLSKRVLHSHIFHILANFWIRNREKYLAELRDVRTTCNTTNFVKFGLRGLIEELEYIKEKIRRKVSILMFIDYVHYLERENKEVPHKVSKRMVHFLENLVSMGKTSLKDFVSSAPITALYSQVSNSTKTRDLQKLEKNELIKITQGKDKLFIEVNLDILQGLEYKI